MDVKNTPIISKEGKGEGIIARSCYVRLLSLVYLSQSF